MVLVAHSYGGLIADIAAAKHPEDIAGVVFVDASEPGAEERFDAILTEAQRAHLDARVRGFPTWIGRRASWRRPKRFRHFHTYRSP